MNPGTHNYDDPEIQGKNHKNDNGYPLIIKSSSKDEKKSQIQILNSKDINSFKICIQTDHNYSFKTDKRESSRMLSEFFSINK